MATTLSKIGINGAGISNYNYIDDTASVACKAILPLILQ